jgi:uncharacterized protein (TIGR02145 family)
MTILRHNRNPLRTADRKLLWLTNQLGYGLLYNWFAATDARGIAPVGWEVPSDVNFATMLTALGGVEYNAVWLLVGGYMKINSLLFWDDPNLGADNSSGLSVKGTGKRYSNNSGIFGNQKIVASFWNSTPHTGEFARCTILSFNSADVQSTQSWYVSTQRADGLSIRLVNNSTGLSNGQSGTMTDYDGNVYPTICINGQEWMASNLKVKHYNNGEDIPNVTVNEDWAALTSGAWCVYDNDPKNM